MSIRGGFDRLTKELDALTYNSRSVLNALIRSTVASGTSQGYTVTRAGIKLTLSRVDIYRLYQFYQAWAVNDFATVPVPASSTGGRIFSFDEIRVEQDKTCVIDDGGNQNCSATTDALVIHSQILFLNSNTLASQPSPVIVGQTVNDLAATSYWLNFLTEFNDPKLLSNSAPIPINLRTPVFDENMGTTAYNNHPTYLFPYQYFGMQLLGYAGDDTDHTGGGNSWTWQLDQYVSFETPAFASGGVNSQSTYKINSERNYIIDNQTGKPFQETYSTVWGFDTHARALGSTAGGTSSMVPRYANHSTSIGFNNLASGIQSTSIGGVNNITAAQNSGVYAGKFNVAAAGASFATNSSNITGGVTFSFTLPQSNTSDECIVDTSSSDCEAITVTTGSQFGANVIAIDGNQMNVFDELDGIVLYAYTTFVSGTDSSGNTYHSVDGDTFQTVSSNIESIYYDNSVTSLNNGKTIITLSDDIPNPARIDGGSITRTTGRFGNRGTLISLGNSSAVFGEGNYASGVRQTVVGSFNRPVVVDTTHRLISSREYNFRLSRFVVGTGSSNEKRNNTLEVYDGRLVAYANGQALADIPITDTQYSTSTFIGFNVDDDNIRMIFNSNRIEANVDGFILQKLTGTENTLFIRSTDVDEIEIENWQKSIKIQTGANTALSSTGIAPNLTGLDIGIISGENAIISASALLSIQGNTLSLRSNSNAYISWDANLILDGNTYGALPTTDNQYAHEYGTGTESLDYNNTYLTHSGFYSINAFSTVLNSPNVSINDWMLMTTSSAPTGSDVTGRSMQLTIGNIDEPTRPYIRTGIENGTYTTWKELALMNDVNPVIKAWRDAFEDGILVERFTYYVTDTNYYTKVDASSFVQASYKVVGTTYFMKIIVNTIDIFSVPAALVGNEEAAMIELCVGDNFSIIKHGVSTGVNDANLTNLVVANPYTNIGSSFNQTYSTGVPHDGAVIRFRRFEPNGSLAPWSDATDGTVSEFTNDNITVNTNNIKLRENQNPGFSVDDVVTFNVLSGTVPVGLTDGTQYQILTATSDSVWRDGFIGNAFYTGTWVTKYYVTLSDLSGVPVDITDANADGTYEIIKAESSNPANEVVTYEFVMEMEQ